MPETRLAKTRASLPEGYQYLDAVFSASGPSNLLFQRNLRDNFRNGDRFVVDGNPSKTLANLVDDAAMRAAYAHIAANVIEGERPRE